MKYFSFFTLLLVGLILVGCGEEDKTIKIGLAGVLTGPDGGEVGIKMFYGAELAIEEWNERGGVLGKQIEVISRDDEGKPNQAVAVAHDLVGQRIVAVLGHLNSGCTLPASPIYAENNVLQITASTNPTITEQRFSTLFRINGRDDQQGPISAEFAWNELKIKTIAIFHNKTAYGQGISEEFKKKFESLGGQIVAFDGISSEEMDFRANITVLKDKGAEALFFGGMYAQAGPLFNQMRQADLNIPFLAGDGCFDQNFLNAIGSEANGVYVSFGPDYKNMSSAQEFLKKYREKFGEENAFSIYGYESANVYLKAVQEAGTTDAQKVATMLKSKTFNSSMGPLEFDSKGDLKKSIFMIWKVENGKFVPWQASLCDRSQSAALLSVGE